MAEKRVRFYYKKASFETLIRITGVFCSHEILSYSAEHIERKINNSLFLRLLKNSRIHALVSRLAKVCHWIPFKISFPMIYFILGLRLTKCENN